MQAFTAGKTEIVEDDAVALLRWAHEMRMGALMLDMVLNQELTPVVEAGVVKVGLPAQQPQHHATPAAARKEKDHAADEPSTLLV